MARLRSTLNYSGTLNELTAYKLPGSDETYLRTKGGPSSQTVKNSPNFENLRHAGKELGGRATTTKAITPIIGRLRHIINYPVYGKLNALLKPAQLLDTTSKKGQRNVLLSHNPQLLEGLNMNNRYGLENVIKSAIPYSIDKGTLSAEVTIPALKPDNNLYIPEFFDWYRITAVLGIVPDHFYHPTGYTPDTGWESLDFNYHDTDWFVARNGSSATTLQFSLRDCPHTSFSLMLVLGVSFGKTAGIGTVDAIKYAGALKIIGMK